MKKVLKISGIWKSIYGLLNKRSKSKYRKIVVLSFIGAILELIGISILLHTVLSILKPGFIAQNTFTSIFKEICGVQSDTYLVLMMSVLLLLVYVVKNFSLVMINKSQIKIAYQIAHDISENYFKNIVSKSLLYFKNKKSAETINALFATSITFPETLILSSILIWSEIAVILLLTGALLYYQPFLFVFIILITVSTSFLLIRMNRKTLFQAGEKLNGQQPKHYENISELTNGISSIKLWNGMEYFHNRFSKYKQNTYKLKEEILVNSHFIPLRIYEVVAIAGIMCIVSFGIYSDFQMSILISYVSIYAGVAFRLLPSINRIIGSSNNLFTYSYILNYFQGFNDEDFEDVEVNEVKFSNTIHLEKVSFGYDSHDKILDELDLIIRKGDFIGILGESGQGKSTLVNVISSLLPLDIGSIKVDDNLVYNENLGSYRYLFSCVKQDVFMLNDSILKNVAFLASEIDEVRVQKCLDEVNLADWVGTMDEGLNTMVGELGNKISGGQKQRIAIARALYKEAEIFIFDEVTNNLDVESKDQILKTITGLKKQNKTVLFITHKEDELSLCDKVYLLRNGKLENRQV